MQDFKDKKILLGVCGGIAAYKAIYLVRQLTQAGAKVRVVMTESAKQFIQPLTFQALTHYEVRSQPFDTEAENAMGHIELARWADYLLVAPLSANTMAKLAIGMADDLLTTLYLVANVPIILCPAMNQSMWHHPATQKNYQVLKQRGAVFLGPDLGIQACGEYGLGRLVEEEYTLDSLRLHFLANKLAGKKIVITAGPTQESIDPVRFISNHSSGKMGFALAKAALIADANVTLISGPSALKSPPGVTFHSVITGKEMYDEVLKAIKDADIFIANAAVGDYCLAQPYASKIKKTQSKSLTLSFTPNIDILASVLATKPSLYTVGFAAETQDVLALAKEKFARKTVDLMVANLVSSDKGFGSDYNEATLITAKQTLVLPYKDKIRLAGEIIAFIAATLQNGRHLN